MGHFMKLKIELELEFDETLWYDDTESKDWFFNDVLRNVGLFSLDEFDLVGDTWAVTNVEILD